MIQKVPGPPITRRVFTNSWAELDYLCQKIHYWLHGRKQKAQAQHYVQRLSRVLKTVPENTTAILREDGLALLAELQGDFPKAVSHLRQEIKLMQRLHKEAAGPRYDAPTRRYMLRGRGVNVLRDRQAVLAELEAEVGRQD